MNGRKVAAWAAGVVVLAGIAGAVAFHALVDSDTLLAHAREKVKSAWGRDLAAESISLRVLPRPALRVTKLALSNPDWAQDRHFLLAEAVSANFELLPLLVGRAQVKSLVLEGLQVNLEAGDAGTTFPRRQDARPATADALPLPSLDAIRIRDAKVRSRTERGKVATWTIEAADLTSDAGLKDVRLDAKVSRMNQAFAIKAWLADASRFGKAGAVTDGRIEIVGAATQAVVEGRIPLQRGFDGHQVKGTVKAAHLNEVYTFLGVNRQRTAPFEATFESHDDAGAIAVSRLSFTLGTLKATGDAKIVPGERIRIDARLASDRLDWAQAFLDSGGVRIPEPRTDKLYSDRPMAWKLLRRLEGREGTVDVALKTARLRNGLELADVKLRLDFRDDKLEVKPFSARLLGGTATGTMSFDAAKLGVRVQFGGRDLLLERWLKERGSKVPFTGGPMAITASFSGTGESMQDVAASITGPIAIRMGRGTWHSQRAGEVETLMTNAFAAKDARTMEFTCVSANLPFKGGRATAQKLVGARSEASRFVSGGTVDFREGQLELRGKVEAQKGMTIGISAIANDIVIAGPLRKPKVSLDSGGAPAAIARVGVAIATAGASLLGTAIAEAATDKNDPCATVFR